MTDIYTSNFYWHFFVRMQCTFHFLPWICFPMFYHLNVTISPIVYYRKIQGSASWFLAPVKKDYLGFWLYNALYGQVISISFVAFNQICKHFFPSIQKFNFSYMCDYVFHTYCFGVMQYSWPCYVYVVMFVIMNIYGESMLDDKISPSS